MQCKNCGATINDGDSFCRTCAIPITKELNPWLDDISNPATNAFIKTDMTSIQQQEPVYVNNNFQNISVPNKKTVKEFDNKEFIKKDGNDRVGATIKNFLGLAIILVIIAVIAFLLYDNILKEIF